ncbi:MAG: 23S rRNA (guanosine(2251)-2'-O)-methyltransferase RlmB [Burkholderiaceae bacterium]|nr:23S rRNA (guanosine(2251)-2'-O)-methyltransferase RlmB [Burkholderiaceae bacterium]MBR4940289.1 23S rRNA (guanosine(2251)-2'-O)-methyltransferase RlmB [Burkholderiaceae bacterium]
MAKNIVLAGFHAVGARLRKDPDSLVSVYVDRERRDKRMVEMRKQLEEAGVRVMLADHARLSGMVSREIPHQGIVAMAREIETGMSFDELMDQIGPDSLFLILDGVTDPRNFGACLRSADAAGATAVIIPKDRSASVTPAAAKAAAGAAESIPVVQVTNLAAAIVELRDAGVTVVGAAGETDKTIYDFDQTGAFAWVMGAEGPGLRQLTRKRCDGLAAIPLLGSVESLNVSVATGICLYEAVRQRTMKKLGRKA